MDKNHLPARLLAVALGACALPLAMLGPAHAASTSTMGGSATYQCLGDYDAQAAPTPVTFALIGPPSSVHPGDTLSLSGNLGITLSQTDAQQSRLLLAQNANIDQTDFNLVVDVGGRTFNLKPSSVVSTPSPIKSPFSLTADVSYPDLTIPATAFGVVSIEMPLTHATSTKVSGAPAKVTFSAHLKQDSPLVPGRNIACWADHLGTKATIARIPVQAAPAADRGQGPSAPSQAATPAATTNQGAGSATAAPPPAVAAPPPSQNVAVAPVSSVTSTMPVSAPIPPATVSHQTFVPGWILALFIALFPAAAIAYAAAQHRRLKRFVPHPSQA